MRLRTALLTIASVTCVALPLWAGTPSTPDSSTRMCPRDHKEQTARKHDRVALTPAQEKFVAQTAPLRDSLHLALRDYWRKSKTASEPKNLSAERTRIGDLKKRLEALENDNLETWLSLSQGRRGEGKGHDGRGDRKHKKHDR